MSVYLGVQCRRGILPAPHLIGITIKTSRNEVIAQHSSHNIRALDWRFEDLSMEIIVKRGVSIESSQR